MLSGITAFAVATLVSLITASTKPHNHLHCRADLDDFIIAQSQRSISGVLANIGADGSEAQGVPAGVVVASPSHSDPDCTYHCLAVWSSNNMILTILLDWYTWTRDAALTYKALVERFIAGDTSLQAKIHEYVSTQGKIQGISNPSGSPESGGLGEPKFNVNLTAFTGSWGRPQRDGPPLRATALVLYANWLLANGGQEQALDEVWPVIAKDLAYTVKHWNQTGFDLWEEINGSSFFTLSSSHRALVEGAALAEELGQTCDGCADSALQILCFIQSFWTGGYIDSNINVNDGRTGKDVNSILSSIHTFDPEAECTDSTFQPCSSRALANLKAIVDSFRAEYSINDGVSQGSAVAVGRYAEDVYYNGNPWYLATLAVAEQLYAAIYQWNKLGSITVDAVSLPFFRDLLGSISAGTYALNSETFTSIIDAVHTYADGFIALVQKYTPSNGDLSEQYDRNNRSPLSARNLTWSYAAFLTAVERREGIASPSWGEPGANTVPSLCVGTPPCDSRITFKASITSLPGEDVFITGSLTELGNWAPADAIPLSASKYTQNDPLWYVEIDIPAERTFEYKYIKKLTNGDVVWESDPNREYAAPTGCGSSGTVNDTWR